MKRFSLICCVVLLVSMLCPVGLIAYGSGMGTGTDLSTGTDLCPHEQLEHKSRFVEYRYYDIDEGGHSYVPIYEEYDECMNCHATMNAQRVEGKPQRANHNIYEDGICGSCGYDSGCKHEHCTKYYDLYDQTIDSIDEKGHTWTGYPMIWYDCPDCGASFSSELGTEKVTVWEKHTTITGMNTCWICGYVMGDDYCDHPDKEISISYQSEEFENQGAAGPHL